MKTEKVGKRQRREDAPFIVNGYKVTYRAKIGSIDVEAVGEENVIIWFLHPRRGNIKVILSNKDAIAFAEAVKSISKHPNLAVQQPVDGGLIVCQTISTGESVGYWEINGDAATCAASDRVCVRGFADIISEAGKYNQALLAELEKEAR